MWMIETNPKGKEQRLRAKFGDEAYDDRVAVAQAKADDFPDSQWKEAMFYGTHFENMALTASPEIWIQMREKSHEFWVRLFQKIAARSSINN